VEWCVKEVLVLSRGGLVEEELSEIDEIYKEQKQALPRRVREQLMDLINLMRIGG